MKKYALLTILLIAFGCTVAEAQVDRAKDPNVPCVVVTGAVHMPMRFELKAERGVRVLEALAFAGGPTQHAAGTIKLIRTEQPCYAETWAHKVWPDRPLKITELALSDVTRGDANANLYLNPGDVLLVAESDPIYVSGRVATPRSIYFKQAPSLLDAISLAGGAVGDMSETKVVIFRAGDDKRYKEFWRIDLSELKKHPKRSPLLQAHDIIDVGPTGVTIPRMSPPKYDSPPLDYRPAGPSPDRAKNGITTL